MALEKAHVAGCYFCLSVFAPRTVVEFVDDRDTAVCPHCGIDSVLPGVDDRYLLAQGHVHWFTALG